MKRVIILMAVLKLLYYGCTKEDFETGIVGKVEYGSGDCMPVINYDDRVYSSYGGNLYFVVKQDIDTIGTVNYLDKMNELINKSISVYINNGELSKELPPNT